MWKGVCFYIFCCRLIDILLAHSLRGLPAVYTLHVYCIVIKIIMHMYFCSAHTRVAQSRKKYHSWINALQTSSFTYTHSHMRTGAYRGRRSSLTMRNKLKFTSCTRERSSPFLVLSHSVSAFVRFDFCFHFAFSTRFCWHFFPSFSFVHLYSHFFYCFKRKKEEKEEN